jgi:hypothetical protein
MFRSCLGLYGDPLRRRWQRRRRQVDSVGRLDPRRVGQRQRLGQAEALQAQTRG